jgi:hypothetical protein
VVTTPASLADADRWAAPVSSRKTNGQRWCALAGSAF